MSGEELKNALQDGRASKKMVNVWTLRWSVAGFFMSFAFGFFGIFMFFMEFDEVTGEPIFSNITNTVFLFLAFVFVIFFIILLICRLWAGLYWKNYGFELQQDRIIIKRGVIGRRTANIPYERIQNVNEWRGILDRIFGLYTLQIETAGGIQMGGGGYGAMMSFAEGNIQGVTNPQPITEYIMSRVKGKDGIGDIGNGTEAKLSKTDKLNMLDERLLKGDISEATYKELKDKIGAE